MINIREKTVHVQPKGWQGAKEHSSSVNLSRRLAFFAHFTRASLIIEYVPPLSLLDRRTPLNFRTSFLCSLRFCSRFSLYRRFHYDKIGWSNSNSQRKASKYEDVKSVDLGASNPSPSLLSLVLRAISGHWWWQFHPFRVPVERFCFTSLQPNWVLANKRNNKQWVSFTQILTNFWHVAKNANY